MWMYVKPKRIKKLSLHLSSELYYFIEILRNPGCPFFECSTVKISATICMWKKVSSYLTL